MKASVSALAALLLVLALPSGAGSDSFARAERPRPFSFPADHAAHPQYRTEWWYYTGIVRSGTRTFGYELTFFRVGLTPSLQGRSSHWAARDVLFAHFAVTDVERRRFSYSQKTGRPVLGLAGYSPDHLDVFIGPSGSRDHWSVRLENGAMRLRARAGGDALDLTLKAGRPPVPNGTGGLSRKGPGAGNANYYYSVPRLVTTGVLTSDGRRYPVHGMTWMDHEWGTSELTPNHKGWDWFSLRLSDGSDLMLYVLRDARGRPTGYSSGTVVQKNGAARTLKSGDFTVRAAGRWRSPATRAVYPSGWILTLPGQKLRVSVTPLLKDQELVTTRTTGVAYWEGAVKASGSSLGRAVTGEGYVELTGYAGASLSSALTGR